MVVIKIYTPRSGVIFPLQPPLNGLILYSQNGLKTFETIEDTGSHAIKKSGIRRLQVICRRNSHRFHLRVYGYRGPKRMRKK